MPETKFDGQVTIKVRFKNNPEYKKFRDYILRTKWNPGDVYPTWEEMILDFHCVDDLDRINKVIVMLLQMGFEVYSTSYKLEQQLAEEEHPRDDIPTDEAYSEEEIEEDLKSFNLERFVEDVKNQVKSWRKK